ncbi:cupin domain-containing protein [Henriciella aquimarina]|uniref:cupin domain-containing protein n=1 Tax=Henriciella aquimarina TaxID=545261 RepID=UPI001179B27C|nr:cupin domain-containing protein [Henriciella aquimarina]
MKRIFIHSFLPGLSAAAPMMLADYVCDGPSMVGLARIAAGSTDHFWERHGGGDELLYIFEGAAQFTAVRHDGVEEMLAVEAGDLLLLARDEAHRAHVSEDLRLLFVTPRDGNTAWSDDPDTPLRHA